MWAEERSDSSPSERGGKRTKSENIGKLRWKGRKRGSSTCTALTSVSVIAGRTVKLGFRGQDRAEQWMTAPSRDKYRRSDHTQSPAEMGEEEAGGETSGSLFKLI